MIEFLCGIVYLLLLVRSYKFGVLSPYFLCVFHFFIGIYIRYLVLYFLDTGRDLALTDFIECDPLSLMQMTLFVVVFSLVFELLQAKRTTPKYLAGSIVGSFKTNLLVWRNGYVVIILLIGLSFLLYLSLMTRSVGGVAGLYYIFSSRVSDHLEGLAYVSLLSDFFIAGSVLAFSAHLFGAFKFRFLVYTLVGAALILLLVQGGRGNIIQYVLSLVIVYSLSKGRVTINLRHAVVVFLIVVTVAVTGLANRMSVQQDMPFTAAFEQVNVNLIGALSAPFALYDHYALSKLYAGEVGFDYGVFYLENLVRPIPRSFWPEKPEVLGKKVRLQYWGDSQGGVPPGVIGELYISFSWYGLFFGGILFAYLCVSLHKLLYVSLRRSEWVVFSAVIIPYFAFNLVRGGVDVGFTRIVIYLVFLVILAKLSRIAFILSRSGE